MTLPVPVKTAAPSPMGKGTLSRQLVVRTTALVALVTVALSLFTALASFQILQRQLDDRLEAAISRQLRGGPGGLDYQNGPGDLGGSGLIRIDAPMDGYELRVNGEVVAYYVSSHPESITEEMVTQLLGMEATAGAVTKPVPGGGLYRFVVRERGAVKTVVGLPYTAVTAPMSSQLIMTGLLTLGAILLSYIGARRVVERSLRPLTRLAATATQVSNLPLESGDGHVPIRVAPGDANPASEVGQVGLAFNHMLDNVEGALAARHRSETKVRRFVADASHELRNPLASIRGYAELTRRGSEELPADAAHALGRIEAESERMSALVQDLLLLARLD